MFTPFAQRSDYSQLIGIMISQAEADCYSNLGSYLERRYQAQSHNIYDIWPSGLDLKTICGIEQDWRCMSKPLWKIYWRDYRLAKRTILSEY